MTSTSRPSKAISSDYQWLMNQLKCPKNIPTLLQTLEDNPGMRIDLPEDMLRKDYEKFIIVLASHNNVALFEQIYALVFVNTETLVENPEFVPKALGYLVSKDMLPEQIIIHIRNNIPYIEMLWGPTGPE
jgi:hypothetical protein